MQVITEINSRGFQLRIDGQAWRSDPCAMMFPEAVWRAFAAKEMLVRELAYVLTMVPPLILEHPTVWYHTPAPQFFDLYNDCFEEAIPNLTDPIERESAHEVLARFRGTGRHFPEKAFPETFPEDRVDWDNRRVVLPFSFGKDSLTSLATLKRLGYKVFPVCLDDRVLPRGTAIRGPLQKKLAADFGIQCLPVRNEIQLLSDYQVLERPATHLHRVHVYFVYLLAMLPFCYYYRAPVIVLNNEYCLSLNHLHREGLLLPQWVVQSPPVTARLRRLVDQLTGGAISVVNLIGGLGDFTLNRLLHRTFSEFGALRVSCHMEMNDYSRWCHQCVRCGQAYLFAVATGSDPEAMGFETSMLTADKRDCYYLFRKKPHARDAFTRYHQQAESLAFTMAAQRGAAGPLMQDLRRAGLPISAPAARKLHRSVFKVHGRPGRHPLEKEAQALYRKLVAAFRSEDSF